MKNASKFVKIKCNKCKNEQIIFNKASTKIQCLVCNAPLSKPSGGKAKIDAKTIKVLE